MRSMLKGRRTRAIDMALLVAFAWDLVGEPPTRWHPVVWYGKLIRQWLLDGKLALLHLQWTQLATMVA